MADMTTVAEIIRTHGVGLADRIALIEGEREMTWGELLQRSSRVAQALVASGVGPHDRVAFLDKNGIAHFEVFFAAALLNAVCVDINWRLAAPEIQYIVDDAEAKVFVVGPDFVPVLDEIADELDSVVTFVVIDADHDRAERYDRWVDGFDALDPGVASTSDDIAFQLYSSGTTGRPKGVLISNANFFAMQRQAHDLWGISKDSVSMVAMPLFHIGGGGWAVAAMAEGATSVIVREMDPAALIEVIARRRITHAFLVPAVLQFMLMVPGASDADYSSLEVILYGASPISDEVLARSLEVFRCQFWQAYGLTETTGAIVNLPPEDHDPNGPNRHRLRSCGVPGPDSEIKIVGGPDGLSDLPPGEVGEIWMRSPLVMQGYWNLPEATAEAITADGWFKSGDAGYLDEDGYLYIHDRVKDMIVSGAENIYPAEVENALMRHPGVADVAVIGVPDERWGETPLAVVVAADGSGTDDDAARELIEFSRTQLAKFKCPTRVEWVDELPRNPSGKVLKKDLREPYWAGRDRRVG